MSRDASWRVDGACARECGTAHRTDALDYRTHASGFDVARYLSLQPLFQEMDGDELNRLSEGCSLARLSRGDMVFRVGQPCDAFHVTVTGQVKLFVLSQAGQEKVIEIVGPGQSFAEALMFTGRPYIVNAQTLADSLVLSIGKESVVGEIGHCSTSWCCIWLLYVIDTNAGVPHGGTAPEDRPVGRRRGCHDGCDHSSGARRVPD